MQNTNIERDCETFFVENSSPEARETLKKFMENLACGLDDITNDIYLDETRFFGHARFFIDPVNDSECLDRIFEVFGEGPVLEMAKARHDYILEKCCDILSENFGFNREGKTRISFFAEALTQMDDIDYENFSEIAPCDAITVDFGCGAIREEYAPRAESIGMMAVAYPDDDIRYPRCRFNPHGFVPVFQHKSNDIILDMINLADDNMENRNRGVWDAPEMDGCLDVETAREMCASFAAKVFPGLSLDGMRDEENYPRAK